MNPQWCSWFIRWDWLSPVIYPSRRNPKTHPLHRKQGETFSVESMMVEMLLFSAIVTPSRKRALQIEHPEKPQQPTYMGSYRTHWPLPLYCSTSSWYLAGVSHRPPPCCLLRTQSVPEMETCLVESEKRLKCGCIIAWMRWSVVWPTLGCQSGACKGFF